MSIIADIKNLTVKYGPTPVLDDVSFSVESGDYIGLAGPNGAGKTTLIKALLGLIPAENGEITLFGKNLKQFKQWNKIGYLPQKSAPHNPLFPATVAEVVSLGGEVNDTLELLKISDLTNKLISDLSGGQQQRVFLARALASKPQLLLLDEPSTALDPIIRQDFFRIIKDLNGKEQVAIILITHDTGTIGEHAKKLLYLDKKLVFYGKFSDFCVSPNMGSYFGGFAQHLICHQHEHN